MALSLSRMFPGRKRKEMRRMGKRSWRVMKAIAAVMLVAGFSLISGAAAGQETVEATLPWRSSLPSTIQHEHAGKVRRPLPPNVRSPQISAAGAALPFLPPASPAGNTNQQKPRVFHVTEFGADLTGENDSFQPISLAVAAAVAAAATSPPRNLLAGITDLGGAHIHLDGGTYLLSRPLQLPPGIGNLKILGGSLVAAADFPADGYLIELSAAATIPAAAATAAYEFITLQDLMLDANHRGGGVAIINSLRTIVQNCYISHFTTDGILVRGGHETLIHSSFLGQKITSGADPDEKNFSGVGINLAGNDNSVSDVVIFSASIGVLVSGQANSLSRIHCYNKASGFGGIGIYLRLPSLTQTRIIDCYLDYTGIVAEDPVELLIMGSFFLGDGNIIFKSVKGVMKGVTVVDNLFSGGESGVEIVSLDERESRFVEVEKVVVERNAVKGMREKATSGKGLVRGEGTSWVVDFSDLLLFKDRIESLQYSMAMDQFVGHAVRNVSGNKVVVESEKPVSGTVYVAVEQFL